MPAGSHSSSAPACTTARSRRARARRRELDDAQPFSEQEVSDIKAREADRVQQLAVQGHLIRLWMLPPTATSWRALGLWQAKEQSEVRAMLDSLPMDKWMKTDITPMTVHANDPALARP
jgi:muconolactone delta-isomerase